MFNCFVHFIRCLQLTLLLLILDYEQFSCNIIVGSSSTPFCCCCRCSPSFLNSSRWEIICSNWFSGRFWFIFQERAKVRPPCSTSSIIIIISLFKVDFYVTFHSYKKPRDLQSKSRYPVRMLENKYQKKLRIQTLFTVLGTTKALNCNQ